MESAGTGRLSSASAVRLAWPLGGVRSAVGSPSPRFGLVLCEELAA